MLEVTDVQTINERYEVLFFKCPLCSKSAQTVRHSELAAIISDPAA